MVKKKQAFSTGLTYFLLYVKKKTKNENKRFCVFLEKRINIIMMTQIQYERQRRVVFLVFFKF